MKLEKKLTRLFKAENSSGVINEDNLGKEKAISVISKDVVHLSGHIINEYDIMNEPGKNILNVVTLGDNMLAFTPYSVLLNRGEANAHNTKEYDLEYTMIGNQHHFCHNNKDLVMHIACDNNVVLFIKITDDGIKEINLTMPTECNYCNCCSLYYQGRHAWWLFTDAGIYVLTSNNKGVTSLTDDWTLYTNDLILSGFSFTGYTKVDPVITLYDTNDEVYFMVSLMDVDNNKLFTCACRAYYLVPQKITDTTPTPACVIEAKSSGIKIFGHTYKAYSARTNYFRHSEVLWVYQNSSTNYGLHLYKPTYTKTDSTYTASIVDTDVDCDTGIAYLDTDTFNMVSKNGTDEKALEDNYTNVELLIRKADENTIQLLQTKYSKDTTTGKFILTVKPLTDITLKQNEDIEIFNDEKAFCFTQVHRGLGDEIYNPLKIIYYKDSCQLDFYTGKHNISGMFYTYRDTRTGAYKADTEYNLRSKINVNDAFINTLEESSETFYTYTGQGGSGSSTPQTMEFDFAKDIPNETFIYITRKDNNDTMLIFPGKVGDKDYCVALYKGSERSTSILHTVLYGAALANKIILDSTGYLKITYGDTSEYKPRYIMDEVGKEYSIFLKTFS